MKPRRARNLDALLRRLEAGELVPVADGDWRDWRSAFDVAREERHALGGVLRVVRWPAGARRRAWAVDEAGRGDERVVRPLPDGRAVKAFLADRLAAYERMWDG